MTKGLSLYWDGYGLAAAASGVSVHGRHLAHELVQLGAPPTVVGPRGSALLFNAVSTIEINPEGFSGRVKKLKPLWSDMVAGRVKALRGSDPRPYVLHGLSNFNVPYRRQDQRRRSVLTVHDVIPFLAPDGVSRALRMQLAWLMPRALERADAVVCVSEWTRRTLVERFPFVRERCQVIPNGLARAAAIGSKGPRGSWVEALYIARFEVYKQHALLLEMVRTCPLPLRLTLVTDQRGIKACRSLGADLLAVGRLRLLSQLSGAEVAAAHAASDLYLSASLYEGYCLPAAAALQAGTPVVYLSGSGIDEVVGTKVGVALPRGASLGAWHEAVERALALGAQLDFPAQVEAHLGGLLAWKDAATKLLSLYHNLVP